MNKHVSKIAYPCGRSLGGHMRSHLVDAPPKADEPAHSTVKLASLCDYSDDEEEAEFEDDTKIEENANYEMRQNSSKKMGKAVDSGNTKKFNCVKCGKGFQSLKAMCGHMACHSEKDRSFNNSAHHRKNSSSWFNHKIVMDSHSDTETGTPAATGPSSRRRSKRVKHKNNNAGSKVNVPGPDDNNGGSMVSVVENEQEEVAKCLMMLSRDSGNWGGLNAGRDSSELSVKMEEMSRFTNELAEELRNKSVNHYYSPEMWSGSMNKNDRSLSFSDSDYENSLKTNMSSPMPDLRKGKGKIERSSGSKHECPVCLKGFRSGQALGGRKRIHLSGAPDEHRPGNDRPSLRDSSS